MTDAKTCDGDKKSKRSPDTKATMASPAKDT